MTFSHRAGKITYLGKPTDVNIYSANDTQELLDGLKGCTNHETVVQRYDLIDGTIFDEWSGAKSKKAALGMVRHGTDNTELLKDVKSYLDKASTAVKVQKYREITYRPFGSAPCVPRLLSGNPNCMILPKKTPVRSRILKVLVDCAVSWYFTADDYRRIGSLLARAIFDIEQAGYRVRLHVVDVCHNRLEPSKIVCAHVMIKSETEPINLQRLLYPISEASFLRHLGFTTLNRAEGWNERENPYPTLDGDNNPEDRKALYEFINGPETVALRMQNLANVLKRGDIEDVKALIKMIFDPDVVDIRPLKDSTN